MSDSSIVLPNRPGFRPPVEFPTLAVHSIPQHIGEETDDNAQPVLPDAGEEFLDFRLVLELGRGSFGKVFLARQKSLADRPVALKISGELFDETQTLAQLQHTNIVPIYSAHRAGRLQAVCMPFFGATTLADVVRGLQRAESLPTTGRHFVSTIENRTSSRLVDESRTSVLSHRAQNGSSDAPPSPAVVPGDQPTYALLNHYTFVDAVLWLGARLAEGLTHAHERGVIHRDLKPANVLLADDGRPMLLDFNLSTNPRQPGAVRGGTIPYMAPEQFRRVADGKPIPIDARVDIYALGLILYELLTGRPAWPRRKGPASEVVPRLLEDRRNLPAAISHYNHSVTPAVEAIICRCLAFDPAQRYPSARALLEDLERQLVHLPLKNTAEPSVRERAWKWARRHPRLTSAGSLSTLAAGIVFALGAGLWNSHSENRRRDAQDTCQQFLTATDDLRNSLIRSPDGDDATRVLERVKEVLTPYGVLADANWQTASLVTDLDPATQARLRQRMGETLLLFSQRLMERVSNQDDFSLVRDLNDRAGACYQPAEMPLAWWWQRHFLNERMGDFAAASTARNVLEEMSATAPTDLYLFGLLQYQSGRYAAAAKALEQSTQLDPQHYWAWVLLGNCRSMLNQDAEAVAAYTVALGINAKNYRPYYNRAQSLYRMGRFASALSDFEESVRHGSDKPEALIQQARCLVGISRIGQGEPQRLDDAEAILTDVIESGKLQLRAFNARADVRRRKRDRHGAAADQEQVLKLEPVTAADYIARGLVRASTDPTAALQDYRAATKLNPWSITAYMNQANVLAERLNRPEDALRVLDQALEIAPEYPRALGGKAIILARLGRTDEAIQQAENCITKFDHPFIRYQMAGVYALTADRPGHVQKAVQLIAGAVRQNLSLAELIPSDRDLKPLEKAPEFRKLREATSTLRAFD